MIIVDASPWSDGPVRLASLILDRWSFAFMRTPVQPRQLLAALASAKLVSATQLAIGMNVTRAAVCKHMDALRADGVPLLARTGVGYGLPWPIQLLDADAITRQLPKSAAQPVAVHWTLDSTSSELARRSEWLPDLAVVLAEGQQSGRGRRGRPWLSPPGLNVYLSCLKRFDCGFAGLSGLSLAVGVAVVRALEGVGVHAAGLKWPNDVMVGEGKLAGILVELTGECQGPCTAIVGVGVNVRLTDVMREKIDQPVVDLATLCDGHPPDRNVVAASLIAGLRESLCAFDRAGFSGFAEDFARLDLLRDKPLLVSGARDCFQGTGAGVDEQGALKVRTDGGLVRVDSAEVSVRAQ